MAQVIFFNSYKLKKSTCPDELMQAINALHNEHIKKQPGFITASIMQDGETWADSITFETMQHAQTFVLQPPNELAKNFYALININSCKTNFFTIQKEF